MIKTCEIMIFHLYFIFSGSENLLVVAGGHDFTELNLNSSIQTLDLGYPFGLTGNQNLTSRRLSETTIEQISEVG